MMSNVCIALMFAFCCQVKQHIDCFVVKQHHHVSFQDTAQVTPVRCVLLFVGHLSHPRVVSWMNVVSTHTSANTGG